MLEYAFIMMKKILVLSTQRSGSTMVCGDMASSNVLGKPNEYYINIINLWNKSKDKDQVLAALKNIQLISSSANGTQAVKIMSNQIAPIGHILYSTGLCLYKSNFASFFAYFSEYKIARVIRRDKVAQAVSRIMAEGTGIYHCYDPTKSDLKLGRSSLQSRDESGLKYSYELIQTNIDSINKEEDLIQDYLDTFSLKPFNIIYENAISSRSYINDIASLIDITPVSSFPERAIKKVSGSISQEWIDRFKEERATCKQSC